jgi:general secretion pathway protein H
MACRHSDPAGFTLVEMLAVVAVIGLASAAVMVAMPDPRGSLRGEAERFAARIDATRDMAITGAQATALVVRSGGYGLERRRRGEWQAIAEAPLEAHTWPAGVSVRFTGDDSGRVAFDEMGAGDPATIILSRGDERASVRVDGNGKVRVEE